MTDLITRIEGGTSEARPLSEWHEDIGNVLWWRFPIEEAPFVGTPNDLGQCVEITVRSYGVDKLMRVDVGGWPGYHTHWTPISMPKEPAATLRAHAALKAKETSDAE